jgi:hypothetical protein
MLTATDAIRTAGRRRPPPSLTQLYNEYVMQRIEAYKNSISRDELMRLGGDAADELFADDQGQLVLTEVLMHEVVDEQIKKRLKLKSLRRWKESFMKLRVAQREPTHWGLDTTCPVVHLLSRLEPTDRALTIGTGAELPTYLVLAHEVEVIHWGPDMGLIERLEQRCVTETMAARLYALTVQLATWIPATADPFDLMVIDLGVLEDLDSDRRYEVLRSLQERTREQGVHVLLPSPTLVPEAVYTFYEGWKRESPPRRKKGPRPIGQVLTRPCSAPFRRAARA